MLAAFKGWLLARMQERTSHLAITGAIMLPLLQLDGMVPLLHWPYGGIVVLFLFPEAPAWAKLIGLPLPPQVAALLSQDAQPSGLDVRASAMQPQENLNA